jgi:hypothetical protein
MWERATARVRATHIAICCRRASLHIMLRPTRPPPSCAVAAAPEARARWLLWSAPRAHWLSRPVRQCVEGRLPRAGAARDVMFSSKKCSNIFIKMLVKTFWKNVGSSISSEQMLMHLFSKYVDSTFYKKCWFSSLFEKCWNILLLIIISMVGK